MQRRMAQVWPSMGVQALSGRVCFFFYFCVFVSLRVFLFAFEHARSRAHACCCLHLCVVLLLQASAVDPAEPVALTIDFGASKKIQAINIQWEHPAKSFSVSLTADGVKWQEVFATDSNVLGTTNIPIGHVRATKARVVMHEARTI